uniref:Uncharacterized protein n=1 Tax=Cacopsylla melanoneura TaxID=428564 RepID=A0A8D8M8W0_9HEMI
MSRRRARRTARSTPRSRRNGPPPSWKRSPRSRRGAPRGRHRKRRLTILHLRRSRLMTVRRLVLLRFCFDLLTTCYPVTFNFVHCLYYYYSMMPPTHLRLFASSPPLPHTVVIYLFSAIFSL